MYQEILKNSQIHHTNKRSWGRKQRDQLGISEISSDLEHGEKTKNILYLVHLCAFVLERWYALVEVTFASNPWLNP